MPSPTEVGSSYMAHALLTHYMAYAGLKLTIFLSLYLYATLLGQVKLRMVLYSHPWQTEILTIM